MIVRSRAPLRISLAGGGTDVAPYCDRYGGSVLSLTIAKYAYCTVVTRRDAVVRVHSIDRQRSVEGELGQSLALDGELDLASVVLNRFTGCGADITIESQVPPGSGLGSSSAIAVALIGALTAASGDPIHPYEVAHLAYVAERVDLGIKGGKQDQYACAFGGCNFIEFSQGSVVVHPLKLPAGVMPELQFCLMLCYTGEVRPDGGIMEQQIRRNEAEIPEVLEALHETKRLAEEMRTALLQGRISAIGSLLNRGWSLKQRFAQGVATRAATRLCEVAMSAGATGGKLLGAGGGGYLLLLVDPSRRRAVSDALEAEGGHVESVVPELDGLRIWHVATEDSDPNRISGAFTAG